ncbi:MAG: hypothetical protein LBM00_02110 [Deltaproteobacteria bacterium]|nr:hypothetical protein [Deltaproteobacteria bacterium]
MKHFGTDMAKRFFMACLMLGSALALAACGGGGGGGGGGSASLPAAMTKADLGFTEAMKGEAVAADNSNTGAGTQASAAQGITFGDDDGFKLDDSGSFVIKNDQGNEIAKFATGADKDVYFYEVEQGNLIVGETDTTDDMIGKINAVVRDPALLEAREYNHELIFTDPDDPEHTEYLTGEVGNGKTQLIMNKDLVALEHSTFGAWIAEQVWQGEYVSSEGVHSLTSEGHILAMEPLFGGVDAQKLDAPSSAAFTGNAVALLSHYAQGPDFGTYTFFNDATASLTVNGTTGTLVVGLPDYFDVTWSGVAVSGSTLGDWSNDSLSVGLSNITDASRNWDAAVFTEGQVAGGFYKGGSSDGFAGEAVGKFQAYSDLPGEEGEITISGAFGVKR